jgi:quinone-modifying oxidoreductase subunit QmoC
MVTAIPISQSRELRSELARRGVADAARCMQCATCTSVCDLAASSGLVFPRRQVLLAQWGQVDRLVADPALWLCHGCNDCSARCPRDARPGDAMSAIRSIVIEQVAAPRALARLVGRAATTWPLLVGAPILLWVVLVGAVSGFTAKSAPLAWSQFVPQWLIYAVFLPAAAFAVLASIAGARSVWAAWGGGGTRHGSLLSGLARIVVDVVDHRRFAACRAAAPRRSGHLVLLLGFLGALLTTSLLGVAMDVLGVKTPLPQTHPIKLLGNVSAILLVVGTVFLASNRLRGRVGVTRAAAFDTFFLSLVAAVVATGIGAELGRVALPTPAALAIYLLHLGTVLSLFLTFPFSKFAHALYRTLAMAHERLTH